MPKNPTGSPRGLTPREVDVLRFVAHGLTNEDVADVLSVTTGTVNSHVHNILKKLRVTNRTQATLWAISSGLASPPSLDSSRDLESTIRRG